MRGKLFRIFYRRFYQASNLILQYKLANKQQGATNYVLDSEPDDDESDDETKPKYEIPYWAQGMYFFSGMFQIIVKIEYRYIKKIRI